MASKDTSFITPNRSIADTIGGTTEKRVYFALVAFFERLERITQKIIEPSMQKKPHSSVPT
jgi:hypothetical protein